MDLAPGQSLCKALKILTIYSCRDAKSSWAKPYSHPVNLPGAWPLMKPLSFGGKEGHTNVQISALLGLNWGPCCWKAEILQHDPILFF